MDENKIVIREEIASQAETIRATGQRLLGNLPDLTQRVKSHANLRFVGCGSSYHAAIMAAQVFNGAVEHGVASSIVASDFIIYPDSYLKHCGQEDLFVLISRTGRTTETLIAADIVRKRGLSSLAVTTFADSELALNATSCIVLTEAQEQSITATRSVTSTTVALLSLVFLAKGDGPFLNQLLEANDRFFLGFQEYCDLISRIVNTNEFRKFIFLGSGAFYGLAREAELKVKEMSLTDTEANRPLEFRHGHKSILDPRCLVVVFPTSEGLEYERGSLSQLRQLGAKLLVICCAHEAEKLSGLADFIVGVDVPLTEEAKLVYYQIFGQLAGFYKALNKGIDPSSPKGLEYCVTF